MDDEFDDEDELSYQEIENLTADLQLRMIEWQRNLYELFDSLDMENLKRFKQFMRLISNSPDANKTAMFWNAWAEATLKFKFGVEPVKGLADDDEALQKLLENDPDR